jgi:phenylalanyl-tRNA synthetase beta chain
MKISEHWLREWVSPKLDTTALAEKLTMAGLEVDSVEPVAPPLPKVVVGAVLEVAAHPDADRLRVCKVDIGRSRPVTIVCGAANVAPGVRAPTALPGAVLPNGLTIKASEIRGQKSGGMLCAAAELGLAETSEGLMLLPADAPVGVLLTEYLGLLDHTIEVDLTPNRSDCLSVAGVAREVAALTGSRLKEVRVTPVKSRSRRELEVRVLARKECPHYVGRVIEHISPEAKTPIWMTERLRRSGVRTIHPVVDVTNYVMLELGQPMHAFDLDRLYGGIVVRRAKGKEELELLDGSKLTAESGTLLIADRKRPLALAGIMGGADSAVSASTQNVFLESAYFAPEAIAGRARSMGLHTDSSHRFERGVDPALQRRAMERATGLLLKIVGGRPGPVTEVAAWEQIPRKEKIRLRHQRAERVLGMSLRPSQIETVLGRLGMDLRIQAGGWSVTPPSYRFDISREVDLIEEIARVLGYDQLPARQPRSALRPGAVPEGLLRESRVRHLMVDRDYQEVVTYSFVDPELEALLQSGKQAVRLANPIAANMAVMRTSLWPGLIETLRFNLNRQQERVRVFELGNQFAVTARGILETRMVAGAVTGPRVPVQWGLGATPVDFFDIKGDVEALLALSGSPEQFRFVPADNPALHPGQSARIELEGGEIGWIGAVHPGILDKLGVDRPIYLFEIDLLAISRVAIPKFVPISRFPSIRRDLALIVDRGLAASTVMDCVRRHAGALLVNLELFDEYRGEGIDSGRKSLGLGLTLQDSSRTLNEEAVDAVITRVVGALAKELSAQLRQ